MLTNAIFDVVLPVHNEGSEIIEVVERLRERFLSSGFTPIIHIVADGPDQETTWAANRLESQGVDVSILGVRSGKGTALRFGLQRCSSEFVGYIDGDLDIDPVGLIIALSVVKKSSQDEVGFVYGSKLHQDTHLAYPRFRKVQSAVYRKFVEIAFGLDVDDTQTGLKVYRREAIAPVITSTHERGFLFDVELLYLLTRRGWKGVSVPVKIDYQFNSTISVSEVVRILRDTLLLLLRLKRAECNRPTEQK